MYKPLNSCIITATTANFVQWTMVMIHSFLRKNNWFKGDVLVICDGLPDDMASDFKIFKQVKLVRPSENLMFKLDLLTRELPAIKNLISRFYSLEAFRFSEYDKVLYLDSDMIFLQSIEEIFSLPDPLYACCESCYYDGLGRKISTFEKIHSTPEDEDYISKPINSGFLLIDKKILGSNHFERLIALIEPELWKSRVTSLTDQLVINYHFRHIFTLLDARYNYRIKDAAGIKVKDSVMLSDAKVIHYFRGYKPWKFKEVLISSAIDMNMIIAYDLWYQEYVDFLKVYHLQKKLFPLRYKK